MSARPAPPATSKSSDKLGAASPAGSSAKDASASTSTSKPDNIFQNDGSYLQKFQKPKEITPEEKRKQALAQKKAFDDRFKKRGKRLPPPSEDEAAAKKPKKELSAYEKEVQQYESRSLKDAGSGVRSNMK